MRSFIEKIKQRNKMMVAWKMDFPSEVVQVPAKLLKNVEIYFDKDQVCKMTEWGNEIRQYHFLKAIPLKKWILVFPDHDKNKARLFEEKLRTISLYMNFKVDEAIK